MQKKLQCLALHPKLYSSSRILIRCLSPCPVRARMIVASYCSQSQNALHSLLVPLTLSTFFTTHPFIRFSFHAVSFLPEPQLIVIEIGSRLKKETLAKFFSKMLIIISGPIYLLIICINYLPWTMKQWCSIVWSGITIK